MRPELTRRELVTMTLILLGALVIRWYAVIGHRHAPLVGDGPNYDATGRLFVAGKLGWQIEPLGGPHPSAFKPPLYGMWVGIIYRLLGESPERVELVQALVSLATIIFIWLTARRLFSAKVALLTAAVVAIYPLAWQHVTTLYPEALAVPIYAAIFWAVLGRPPTVKRAAAVGLVCGVTMLMRPQTFLLLPAVAMAWILGSDLRYGSVMSALTVGCAVLMIIPLTIRNALVLHAFIPIDEEDSAIEGTFNSVSAHDRYAPYAWRAYTPLTIRLLHERPLPTEVEVRSARLHAAFRYIDDHPPSLPAAFFWNGLSRTWDIRAMRHVIDDARFEGRDITLAQMGIIMYWIMLPLALLGLYRLRHRRELVLPLLLIAVGTSLLYTAVAATRYRAPLEPVIAMLAVSAFFQPVTSVRSRIRSP